MDSIVVFLSVYLLLLTCSVLAEDTTNRCYSPTNIEISPRARDSKDNFIVHVIVSANHTPGMSLCFHGMDATYELYPVTATSSVRPRIIETICRPLKPSKSVTSIEDPCFSEVLAPVKSEISASGIKQRGTYTMCSTGTTDRVPTCTKSFAEQKCKGGLFTQIAHCTAPSEDCPLGVDVVSYYCPDIKSYRASQLQYNPFKYKLEIKKTLFSSNMPALTSLLQPKVADGDQPNPYDGWTFIYEYTSSRPIKYTARPLPVIIGDCSDYCAAVYSYNYNFYTQQKCYTTSADLCLPTRQVTWQEFNSSRDEDQVVLPYTARDGSVLDTNGGYSTFNIVNPFTYTIKIEMNAPRADPDITASCAPTSIASTLKVGVKTQKYPNLNLVYVRRVCDQQLLSLGDCIVQYSHHDDSAMFWTVENTGSTSECIVHVIDDTTVHNMRIVVRPVAKNQRLQTTKRPSWEIAVITIGAIILIVVGIIAVLCMCQCSRHVIIGFFHRDSPNKKALETNHVMVNNPLDEGIYDGLEMHMDDIRMWALNESASTSGSYPPLSPPASIDAAENSLSGGVINVDDALNLPSETATSHTSVIHIDPSRDIPPITELQNQSPLQEPIPASEVRPTAGNAGPQLQATLPRQPMPGGPLMAEHRLKGKMQNVTRIPRAPSRNAVLQLPISPAERSMDVIFDVPERVLNTELSNETGPTAQQPEPSRNTELQPPPTTSATME